jgi:hypothetical protein
MAHRCVLKRLPNGKFRLRKAGVKCTPGKAAAARHAKKFGYSGSKAHRAHAMTIYHKRVANLKKARAARVR